MSQSDRAIKKLATELARLKSEVVSWRGAQADYTSIEGGTMDINDSDGNLVSRVGYQDDGSGAVRFFDGPVPPVPSGVTATSDGPIIQATWDGSFVDGLQATYDLAYLEVAATLVDDDSRVSFATITAKEGASASVVANQPGLWAVAVRSVSQAGKKSEFFSAGTVEVKLVDLAGAIEAVQDSANGKNKVTYSEHAPTPEDPGIFDDTWFVGQVGRPNDVVEATNLWRGSKLSADRSSVSALSRYNTTQVEDGLQIVSDGVERGAFSLVYTASGYRVDIEPGKPYSWSFPVRNSGDQPYPVGFASYSDQDVTFNSERKTLAPGESHVFKIENVVVQNAGDIRFSLRYEPGDPVGPEGAMIVLQDGVTLVRSATAADPFNGDTPSGETVNESHYRWTGTPHASTSEKYLPALDIGASDNWNVIEQYRHDGAGWVKVELSHYVFSTVDLGKATVGELDGIRIRARTITGDLFSGDAFDGIVFRGNTFVTRDGNGEFSDRGLFFQKPDGTAIFRVPTDGTPISMSASDVQIERAQVDELELNVGRVRSGGLFELSSGVTTPVSPPELNSAWHRHATLTAPEQASSINALGYWSNGNKWVRAIDVTEVGVIDRIETYDFTTGEVVNSFEIGLNPRHGLTVVGDVVYVMGKDYTRPNPEVYVFGYDLNTGERVTRWEYTRGIQALNPLGNDGTNLIIASVYNLELWVHRRDPVTGVQVGSDMRSGANSWPATGGKDLYAVRINGNDVEVVTSWGARVYLNSNNVLVRKTDTANASGYAGWELPTHDVSGCVWVNGTPYPVDSQGNIYGGVPPLSDSTIRVTYTWWDGTHETTPAPIAEAGVPAQQNFIASVPVRPGLSKRVYGEFSAAPGAWYRATLGETDTTVSYYSFGGSPTTLPTSNSFPNADPAVFRSTNGNVVVRGDGSGKWGPLTFNPDGTMTSSQIPEWVPVTTFLNGAGPQTFGHTPAYRVWPDGKVEWRGVVVFPSSSNIHFLTVPSVARPSYDVHWACVTDSSNPGVSRVDICDPNAPTVMKLAASSARVWVSLDGIYYYLT